MAWLRFKNLALALEPLTTKWRQFQTWKLVPLSKQNETGQLTSGHIPCWRHCWGLERLSLYVGKRSPKHFDSNPGTPDPAAVIRDDSQTTDNDTTFAGGRPDFWRNRQLKRNAKLTLITAESPKIDGRRPDHQSRTLTKDLQEKPLITLYIYLCKYKVERSGI